MTIADYVPTRRSALCPHCVHVLDGPRRHQPYGGIGGVLCTGCQYCRPVGDAKA